MSPKTQRIQLAYVSSLHQALLDVSAWVEKGIPPGMRIMVNFHIERDAWIIHCTPEFGWAAAVLGSTSPVAARTFSTFDTRGAKAS